MTKMYKAHILSRTFGTVQIGRTVYQPSAGEKYRVTDKPKHALNIVLVSQNSIEGAREALAKDAAMTY